MGHNSTEYVHTVTEALKLALADRDLYYGDTDFAMVPARGLLSEAYAAGRRALIDPLHADNSIRPGEPWKFESGAGRDERRPRFARAAPPRDEPGRLSTPTRSDTLSPDTTNVNVADARGNLFSASPSSGWFFGGVFIPGDTGVPFGNRMQAFVLNENLHPNLVQSGKRPRTTLSPTIVLRDGKPFLALSSPGGDSQDQQALQVLLNMAVFDMRAQADSRAGVLQVEDRIPAGVLDALGRRGHRVNVVGPFMMDTGTAVAGVDPIHATLFGAADVRRERFAVGW